MTKRNEVLHDIFTTAMEGGVNYWASVTEYGWSCGDGHTPDTREYHADIRDLEDDNKLHHIGRHVMAHGYKLATTTHRDRIAWSSGEKPPLVITEDYDDEWDYDASDADCIVQLGLFGEVVYG